VDESGRSSDSTQLENHDPLAVAKTAPADPAVSVADPVVSAPTQQAVSSDLSGEDPADDRERPPGPLLVRVVRDDDLNAFESKTVKYARLGVGLSVLSLVAAIAAAIVFYLQFREMSKQTGILNTSAQQAKADSKAAGTATATQLRIMQDELTQQRSALETDQRPWLKFELGGERPKDADPNNEKMRLITAAAGQPIKIEVRVTNLGKTAAERILGTLLVQYVSKGGKPTVLPKREIVFTEGRKPKKGALPGTAWGEATIYPNEVSQQYFSRSRWGKTGVVEDDPLTQTEATALQAGNAYILLMGEVWYSDVFGVRHWTKFCGMSLQQLDPLVAKKCVAFGP
jgi:hypothetical protein